LAVETLASSWKDSLEKRLIRLQAEG
jgi:hypothetical protein